MTGKKEDLLLALTHRQKKALYWLKDRHEQYPNITAFLPGSIGRGTSAMLRKLEPQGLVCVDRIASNCFRYALTDAGREALK